jgi:tRNA U34 5-methylaminomethyl-2-thiouridine-forming methyltransferase MnmC
MEIVSTTDGSHTLFNKDKNDHYHSTHGAIQESQHIYINSGLHNAKDFGNPLNILEIGFGTGLNALLTFIEAEKLGLDINYTTVDTIPMTPELLGSLNYIDQLDRPDLKDAFYQMHFSDFETDTFKLIKHFQDIHTLNLPKNHYQLVYYDAFCPTAQPEMWEESLFEKIFSSMAAPSQLITYCAKGSVKRALKSIGFEVLNLPGPPGKYEITLASVA